MEEVKFKITQTEEKISVAEREGDTARRDRLETLLVELQKLLVELQRKENILLSQQGLTTTLATYFCHQYCFCLTQLFESTDIYFLFLYLKNYSTNILFYLTSIYLFIYHAYIHILQYIRALLATNSNCTIILLVG
jgi:hypothetical protein